MPEHASDALLITNETILTMGVDQPTAEAVGVIGDTIIAVATRATVEYAFDRYRQCCVDSRISDFFVPSGTATISARSSRSESL